MNGTALKKAIVATLCEAPGAEKYRQAAFVDNPLELVQSLSQRIVLTKADFFALDEEGKPFLETAGAWKNFDKIAKIVQANGEKFTYDDFTNPLAPGNTKTLLDAAKSNNGLKQVFSFDMWAGRFAEMEKLWFQLASYERNKVFSNGYNSSSSTSGLIPIELKRRLLAVEHKTPPEDRLEKAGLRLDDIRRASMDNLAFDDVNRKLARVNDYFRKEYVLMVDSSGDTMFDGRSGAWNKFSDILKIMQAHGERLEVADYTRKLSNAKSLLERAGEQKTLNKVFAPDQWADRLDDMFQLWSKVPDAWKTSPMTTQDFDNAYATAEGLTYGKRFLLQEFNGKGDLLKPLNPGAEARPVLPLGLKVVWENFEGVQSKLEETGEKLTMTDLRATSGHMSDSCIMIAAKHGRFDRVVEISRNSGEPITLEDFSAKDGHGNTLLNILAEKQQLSLVFSPTIWVGRVDEMRQLWTQVANKDRRQVDYANVETATKQASLKQKRGTGTLKFRPN